MRPVVRTFSHAMRATHSHVAWYTMMIEDWEIGMLYFNCVWRGDTDDVALQKVKVKYLGDGLNQEKRDVRLLVGTRGVHPNWLIIGVYNPPRDMNAGQQTFLDLER